MTDRFRTHGIDLRTFERLPGSVYAFDGTVQVGTAFPVVVADPDGAWYGRRTGKAAVRFDGRHQALAHIVRGCPDCRCDDNTCGVCTGGCPENLCPVGEKASTR